MGADMIGIIVHGPTVLDASKRSEAEERLQDYLKAYREAEDALGPVEIHTQ